MLIVMHDINLAARCADRVGLLHDRIISLGLPEEIIRANALEAAFGTAVDVDMDSGSPHIRLHSDRF